jgi:predicted nucleic acid-binding protein
MSFQKFDSPILLVIVDTSVFISALLSKNPNSAPCKIIIYWREGRFNLVMSPQLLEELVEKLLAKNIDKTDIKDMGSDSIAKEFSTEWVARDTYGKMLSYTATADDIAFNKTLKPKDRAMNVVDPVSRSDFGYWEYTSMGSNLIISAIGKTKETTTLYKYLPDIKKLGENGRKRIESSYTFSANKLTYLEFLERVRNSGNLV